MAEFPKGASRAVFAILLALIFILSSGCVQINVHQYFYPNGRSQVVQQVSVAAISAVMQSSGVMLGNSSDVDWDLEINRSCAQIWMIERSARCARSGDWLIIEQSRVADVDYVFKSYDQFPYTIYELNILRPPVIPLSLLRDKSLLKYGQGDSFSNASIDPISSYRSAGLSYKYYVEMPGEIFNITEGRMDGQRMQFDVLEQAKKKKPVIIKSRDVNWEQVALSAIAVLDIFLFMDLAALYAVHWAKRHKSDLDRLKQEAEERAAEQRRAAKRAKLKGYQVYNYDGTEGVSKLDVTVKDADIKDAEDAAKREGEKARDAKKDKPPQNDGKAKSAKK